MNEMLDKAERAIRAHRHSATEVQAREAIRAIREPTPAFLQVARDNSNVSLLQWHSVIDVILEGR